MKNADYFEGWYYKLVSHDKNNVIALIPGISKTKYNSNHAFIQFIDGKAGKTNYVKYSEEYFTKLPNSESVRIDKNIFSLHGIKINVNSYDCNIHGEVMYDLVKDIRRSIFSPSAMGFFEYIPFMECKHEVLSMSHDLSGELLINDKLVDFTGGKGYIEKDCGTSFPKNWVWIHSNSFSNPSASLMCSVAEIPLAIAKFTGFICIVTVDDTEYRFATYNNSKIVMKVVTSNYVYLKLSNNNHTLEIKANLNTASKLTAPRKGAMTRNITESLNSNCHIIIKNRNSKVLYSDESDCTGLEICY